jgi:hypothetical protein
LGVINEGNATELVKPVCPELSRFIRRHDLKLIIDEGGVPKEAVKLLIGFSSERTAPLRMQRSRLADLAMPNSFRAYGINEMNQQITVKK